MTILLIFAIACFAISGISLGQDMPKTAHETKLLLEPNDALIQVQHLHSENSPVIVAQGELDQLIDRNGGGACPLSAALIAAQGIRIMADLPVDPYPHRSALRMFQSKPELKEGRIDNERFVELLAYVCSDLDEKPFAISTVSAPNSPHVTTGQRWSPADGPDLSTKRGELKILAYTVTQADGTVRGRHFVLLKEISDGKLSFLNPGSPLGNRTFIIEYRGESFSSKAQVFFHSPAGVDKSNQTYELNTVFTIRLISPNGDSHGNVGASIESVKSEMEKLAERLQSTGEFSSPNAWRREGATFGLPGLDLPREVGGGGWSASKTLEIFRHAGRHNLNLRDVIGGAHGRPLVKSDSALVRKVLNDLVAGSAYVAVAITEPEAGTDMKQMQSKAVRYGDGFKLTGRKLWNARLREATHVVLYTLAAHGETGSRSAFLLPIDHPGLRIVDRYAHGLTGNSFGGLEFDDMFVSKDHILGEDGDGGKIFTEHFQYWRLMQAAAAIGCGEAALDQMAERIATRDAFGGPIGRFTHLQQPIGEYLTKLRMAMALAREAADLIDQGDYKAASPLVDGLKAEGVEIALAACDAAMRSHGAMGYSREVDLGDRVRDLMGLRIADGTTDVMRMTVVRERYGYEFWKMAVRSYRDDADELDQQPLRGNLMPVKGGTTRD
ncbi:acyl-CoA dehydrogenase family protein [Novipirellula aureliae]|nr:acyl-CoA dehydrogenase [Novipirellula aureliae]